MNPSKFPRDADRPSQRAATPDHAESLFAPQSNTFSPEDYAVGQVLSGRFRIEHVIGVGSMGVVLAARHLELDERVAIKFIRSEMQQVPGVLSRFAREAKAAVTIKSEHVAQVFDVGTADGIGPYIVMEYLEGRDLGQVLELEGRLTIRRAVHYVMQACEALAVAHASGITHRDIKPENLFLTQKGDLELIKLLDFGISKSALTGKVFGDELSGSEAQCLLGTPLYMSPEQIRSTAEVDHRADIWSLGAVLYELITARSAFVADSVRQVWTRILETSPTPLAMHCPEAPPSLQAVIDRCLEKDPARRFQNVAELAIALLPFAPARARLYAQRASSILGNQSDSYLPAPPSTPAPISRSFVSAPIPDYRSSAHLLALPAPEISAPPVFGRRESRGLDDPRTSRVVTLLAIAGVCAACAMLWVGWQRASTPTATRVDAPTAAALGAAAAPRAREEAAELSLSRMVLVESQPSGALVKVGGQAVGLTPLSTQLPVGTQQLSISKQGYATEQAFLQVDPAPAGAKAVRTRVVLREEASPAAAPEPVARPRAAAPARPPARKTAPARRAEAAREEAAAAVEAAPEPVAKPEPAPSAPLVEERSRVKLVDGQSRARLLD
ncbi:MAG TPA: serine/threonine-protein kinase [Polyangiaceae bacterium]|nr:serine/threonine-protein kinase [Polyangiaceae bacterium]